MKKYEVLGAIANCGKISAKDRCKATLGNISNGFDDDTVYSTAATAIESMFIWADTPGGDDFWDPIYCAILEMVN